MPGEPVLLAPTSQPEPTVATEVASTLGARYALGQQPGIVVPLQQHPSEPREVVLVFVPVDVSQRMEPFEITSAQKIAVGADHEEDRLGAVRDPARPAAAFVARVCFVLRLAQQSDDGSPAAPQVSTEHAPANDDAQRDGHCNNGGYCAHPRWIYCLDPRPSSCKMLRDLLDGHAGDCRRRGSTVVGRAVIVSSAGVISTVEPRYSADFAVSVNVRRARWIGSGGAINFGFTVTRAPHRSVFDAGCSPTARASSESCPDASARR